MCHSGVRHRSCDSEVKNLEYVVAVDHQIGGLDVAMDHPAHVPVREPRAEVFDQLQFTHRRHRRVTTDHLTEGLSLDVLHRDKRPLLVLADVENRDDVSVAQIGGGSSFSRKA